MDTAQAPASRVEGIVTKAALGGLSAARGPEKHPREVPGVQHPGCPQAGPRGDRAVRKGTWEVGSRWGCRSGCAGHEAKEAVGAPAGPRDGCGRSVKNTEMHIHRPGPALQGGPWV